MDVDRQEIAAIVHHRGENQRFAACTRTNLDHRLAGFRVGKDRRQLARLLLDLEPARTEARKVRCIDTVWQFQTPR